MTTFTKPVPQKDEALDEDMLIPTSETKPNGEQNVSGRTMVQINVSQAQSDGTLYKAENTKYEFQDGLDPSKPFGVY